MTFKLLGKTVVLAADSPGGSSMRGPSRLSTVMKCEWKAWMRYWRRKVRTTQDSIPLIGTIFHLHQAFHWASKMPKPPEWFFQTSREIEIERVARGYPAEIEAGRKMDEAFRRRFKIDPWKPLHVEKEIACRIGDIDPGGPRPELDDEIVTCRLDLHAQATGSTLINDYKSKKGHRLPPFEGEKLAHDFQASMNLHITRKTIDPKVGPFFHSRATQKAKRSGEYEFDRQLVRLSPQAYAEAPRVARLAIIKEVELQDKLQRGEKPGRTGRLTGECTAFNRLCDYAPICNAPSKAAAKEIFLSEYQDKE